jgi:CBS domain-containing protein
MAEMVQSQDPVTLSAGTTVQEACLELHRRGAETALVLEHEELRGLFGREEAVHALAAGLDASRTSVGQVMTAKPACLDAGQQAMDAFRLMEDGGYRHVVVVRDGKALGVIAKTDFESEERHRKEEEYDLFEHLR